MRRVESQMTVASAPLAMPAKSRSAGGDRKRSLHRFVVTDAPEDPEVLFSPRTAKPADKILEGTRTRPGKTEQKGRFTIIELVPTSPGSVDVVQSPKAPKEVEIPMAKAVETKPSSGNGWTTAEDATERLIAATTSGEQRGQTTSTSVDRVLHELVDESTKHRSLLQAMLDRNSELLNELKSVAHNCHCSGSVPTAEPVDILGQAAEIKRLNEAITNLTRENQRLEQKNALLEIRLQNQLAVSNDLRQELQTLTNYTESLVQQHEVSEEESRNNDQLSPSNGTVHTASLPPSPSLSLESDSPPVSHDPPKSIPQAPPPPVAESKAPVVVTVNRLKSPITTPKQPQNTRPLTRSSGSSDALDKMMFSQMHLMTKDLASTKSAQSARYNSTGLTKPTASPQKLGVPGGSTFDLFKVPTGIGIVQGMSNPPTNTWPSLSVGLAPTLSAAQMMHPLPRHPFPDGTRPFFTQPHEHFTIPSTLVMDDVVARHEGQLEHYAVPKHLREEALRKVLAQEFGCPALQKQVAEGLTTIVAGETMAKEGQVWILEHLWLFQSARDARQQLENDDTLRSQMQDIATHFSKAPAHTIDEIIVSLIHCAYSIKFGLNASDLYHYVIADAGALLASAKRDFNVQVVPLYCVDTGKLVSLMWPVQTIQAGTRIVRPHATTISLIQLGKQSYWENRYEDEEEFDWYCSYGQMRDLVKRYAPPTEPVLVAGSGASTLPIDMEKDGFTKVTATDYAVNVIEKMKAKHLNTSVTFAVADMTNMKGFPSNSISCVIDKGCLDTMLLEPETRVQSDGQVWKTVTSDNAHEFPEASAVMKECMRLLRPNGYMILLTYGNPNNRMGLLDWPTNESKAMWEIIECQQLSPSQDAPSIAKPFFIYVLQKQPH